MSINDGCATTPNGLTVSCSVVQSVVPKTFSELDSGYRGPLYPEHIAIIYPVRYGAFMFG